MKYNKKLNTEIKVLMAAGMSLTQVAAKWGVARKTIYAWKDDYPEFKQAYEEGETLFDANHEQLGIEGMLKARDIDYQFWRDLGKFRHDWKDKVVVPTTINNTQINFLQDKSNEELVDFIKSHLDAVPELLEHNIIDGEVVE